jgi:hypothetical protein
MAYYFKIRNNKIKFFTEYETVTQKVFLFIKESILQNAKQLQHATATETPTVI